MSIVKEIDEHDGQWHRHLAGRWFGVLTLCKHRVKGEWCEKRWNPDGGPLIGCDQYGGHPSGEWEYRLIPTPTPFGDRGE